MFLSADILVKAVMIALLSPRCDVDHFHREND